MKALLLLLFVSAVVSQNCQKACQCSFNDEEDSSSAVSKQEILAGTLGTLVPLVTGGIGFGIWRLCKTQSGSGGSDPSDTGSDAPLQKSRNPRDPWARRGSSPPPYDVMNRGRRGSTPVSLFEEGEHDDFLDAPMPRNTSNTSLGGLESSYPPWRRGSVAPSSQSINIHRPQKDNVNQWLGKVY